MKDINTKDFKITDTFSIHDSVTKRDLNTSDDKLKDALKEISKELSKLQDKMYAHNRYSMLICLQGMDTSGKDSLIREVFKYFNARGVNVYSFKVPTDAELEHNFLWRHYIALPEKGKFGIFNRSHYENVLVSRVHPELLLKENLPGINAVTDVTDELWNERFEDINTFEKHLTRNGTIVLKFFLNLSKDEQKQRLLRRLDKEKHNWKFSPGDLTERALWDKYQQFYEEVINKTSTVYAPWYVVPADDKATARYIVAKTILDELSKYKDIAFPELDDKIKENIEGYRGLLEEEDK